MIVLRPYQSEARAAIHAAWESAPTTLAVLATGLGKTPLSAFVAHDRRALGRCMFVVHRGELLWQAAKEFEEVYGQWPAIEKAKQNAYGLYDRQNPVVLTTVQTQYSGHGGAGRMNRFDPREFATLIVDEAHHYIAPSYRRVIDYYRNGNPDLRVLGVTATPDRADKLAMGRLFETVAFNYGIRAGIDGGWLVPIDQYTGVLSELDLSNVGTVGGDFKPEELEKALMSGTNPYGVVDKTLERAESRRTLVFACGVPHAKLLTAIFNDRRPDSARYVYEGTGDDERRTIFRDFAAGRFQFLCNVGIATEGFNDPGIECVTVARPTKSRSLYTQMAGRGTRTLKGVVDRWDDPDDRRVAIAESEKPAVLLIDFAGNAGRHKLITSADILGGDYESEVVARVKARSEAGACDVAKALDEETVKLAAERREQRDREEAARLARLRVSSRCDFERVDPFGRAGGVGSERRAHVPAERGRGPSDAQRAFLERHAPKGTDIDAMTAGDAGRMVGEIRRRWDKGLCSIAQSNVLKRNGLPGDVPRDTAKAWLDQIAANRWTVPNGVRAQAAAFIQTQEVA